MTKPTINDVARLAGVSKKTVRRVINRSPLLGTGTRVRVEDVIAQIGFVPNPQARALALRRSFVVALLHEQSASPIVPQAVEGIHEALRGSGLALLLHAVRHDAEGELRDVLQAQRPAAVALLGSLAHMAALDQLCAEFGCARLPIAPAGESAAMMQLVQWLAGNGHSRVALAGWPEGAAARELGYREAVIAYGLDRGPELYACGDGSFGSGIAAGHALLAREPRPSAIVAVTDDMAAGVLHAAAARGLEVPAELSVTGFDDTPLAARLCPPLTTVRIPWAALAQAALLPLAGGARAGPSPEPALPQPTLVVRCSVSRVA